jgi:D-beta-D-heptose 7-phosphate kinase/D-beta-D-heptose 1-phosphate adenosyltransferase
MKTIVLVTGGFDPLHKGHIAYFEAARTLGDELWVGVNSDEWLTRKKGQPFMPMQDRCAIVNALGCVDQVIGFNDDDNSASGAIFTTQSMNGNIKLIFANGGDRNAGNIPEMDAYSHDPNVEFAFGVGGEDKKNSSSWILKEWQKPNTTRLWGNYTVLDKQDTWQVKELCFDVGKSLSDQRHFVRSEHWCVVDGLVKMELEYPNGDKLSKTYGPGESIDIPTMTWHKATNVGDVPAKVVEVWMGTTLQEDDIERRD